MLFLLKFIDEAAHEKLKAQDGDEEDGDEEEQEEEEEENEGDENEAERRRVI
jgi:hypothetical protein